MTRQGSLLPSSSRHRRQRQQVAMSVASTQTTEAASWGTRTALSNGNAAATSITLTNHAMSKADTARRNTSTNQRTAGFESLPTELRDFPSVDSFTSLFSERQTLCSLSGHSEVQRVCRQTQAPPQAPVPGRRLRTGTDIHQPSRRHQNSNPSLAAGGSGFARSQRILRAR